MDWSAIITIILGSSLLGAVLNNFAGWWLRRTEASNQATYLALNLAHLLEQYAYDCLSAADDHDNADSSYGNVGEYISNLPALQRLPEEDYRVFDLALLDNIFDFEKQVVFASESLTFAFQVLDGEDAVAEGYKSCLKLARKSLHIADSVRARYKLRKRSLEFAGYSVRKRITEKLEKVEK